MLIVTTKAGEYAVRAMIYLACRAESGQWTPVRMISDFGPAQVSYLARVLQRLARANLVVSKRGPAGGYALGRPAGEIALLDVVDAVEGPRRSIDECVLGLGECDSDEPCRLHDEWHGFVDALFGAAREVTLDRLASGRPAGT